MSRERVLGNLVFPRDVSCFPERVWWEAAGKLVIYIDRKRRCLYEPQAVRKPAECGIFYKESVAPISAFDGGVKYTGASSQQFVVCLCSTYEDVVVTQQAWVELVKGVFMGVLRVAGQDFEATLGVFLDAVR